MASKIKTLDQILTKYEQPQTFDIEVAGGSFRVINAPVGLSNVKGSNDAFEFYADQVAGYKPDLPKWWGEFKNTTEDVWAAYVLKSYFYVIGEGEPEKISESDAWAMIRRCGPLVSYLMQEFEINTRSVRGVAIQEAYELQKKTKAAMMHLSSEPAPTTTEGTPANAASE